MKKMPLIFALTVLFSASSPLYAARSEDVRDYERLRLLQQATGGGTPPAGSNSFETRVNTLLNVGSQVTPAYESQARVEFQVSEQAREKARVEAAAIEKNIIRNRKAGVGYLPPGDNGLAATNLALESKVPAPREDNFSDKNSYVDATEENFQRLLEKQQQEAEKAKKEIQPLAAKKQDAEKSTTLPSLANNPFYFPANSELRNEEEIFETNKPLILTRMVQSGVPVNEAEQILATSTSAEDVILRLMQDYGQPYGAAKGITAEKKS